MLKRKLFCGLILIVALHFTLSQNAFAYLDPGTGSYIFQVMVADVIGYSLAPPSEPNNFEATRLREKIMHIHGDILDLDRLIETFKKYKPEFVFHLAAQPLVRLSYDEPKMTFDTNVGGTINVFEAVRKTPGVRVIVNVTSDKCYENKEWVWGLPGK